MKPIPSVAPQPLAKPKLYAFTLLYAGLVTLCVTAQLFSLDKMYEHPLFLQPIGAILLPAMILVAVFSLSSLLRLSSSRLMQLMSFICAALLPLLWLFFAFYTRFASNEVGLLGTHVAYSGVTWGIALLAIIFAYGSVLALGRPRLIK